MISNGVDLRLTQHTAAPHQTFQFSLSDNSLIFTQLAAQRCILNNGTEATLESIPPQHGLNRAPFSNEKAETTEQTQKELTFKHQFLHDFTQKRSALL